MPYFFKKGKKTETQKKKEREREICAVYEEGAVTDRTCQKQLEKFHAGNFSVDNAPQSNRLVEVDSNQTETLTENNQH